MATIREHEELIADELKLTDKEFSELKKIAVGKQYWEKGNFRPILQLRNGKLFAQNYVGIVTVGKGTTLEILPKIDLGDDDNNKETKRVFLNMLRTWRGWGEAQFSQSNIDAVQQFAMWDVFVRLFLDHLVSLVQRGLAKHYQPVEDNLHYLKGRILFPQHLRRNLANHARFYVKYDEFNANRPANRLIHSTIDRLESTVKQPENQQLLRQFRVSFSGIPLSSPSQWRNDWKKHRIDRSMPHYGAVMQWVHLFLFGHGLTTFEGRHSNQSLLFPMEEVFEDFVTHSFRVYQNRFPVKAQGPPEALATTGHDKKNVFYMKPDISLMSGDEVKYILDAKWKRINREGDPAKCGIDQSDMYQLYSYGKKYQERGCEKVALIYPQTKEFKNHLHYCFDKDLSLACFPFDLDDPQKSVRQIMQRLGSQNNWSGS
ncbi:MAG: McrC family protein [Gammaproteobacteria bacterium]|nr:McrC family protein [Gammaproteobacteria bacterium]